MTKKKQTPGGEDRAKAKQKRVSRNDNSRTSGNQVDRPVDNEWFVDPDELYDPNVVDVQQLRRANDVLLPRDTKNVSELRAIGVDGRGTISGYFESKHRFELLHAAATLSGRAQAVYVTLNPVIPDLLARAANRTKAWAKHTTSDQDIAHRGWILLDFDPRRPAGISATDGEHSAAIDRAREVHDWLREIGFPELSVVLADSGNGAHILLRCNLPNDDDATELVKRVTHAINLRFSDDAVDVDLTTHNAARITKLYGTLAAKGDSTSDRPHRLSRLLDVPHEIRAPKIEHIVRLAEMAPRHSPPTSGASSISSPANFDLENWIEEHDIDVKCVKPWQGGTLWVLSSCPWNPAHTNQSAYIGRHASGAIFAKCHHASCAEKGWHELRDVIEPGWREQRGRNKEIVLPDSIPADQQLEYRQAIKRRQRRRK